MYREALIRKSAVLGIYLAYFLVLIWVIPLQEYPELMVLSALSAAVVFVTGDRYPGTAVTLLMLLSAAYLGRVYTADIIRYSLPYAKVAVISLLSVLVIPAYLVMSSTDRLVEALIGGAYVAAFMMSVVGPRSLAISLSLFASLSVVTMDYVLAASMSVSYSVFYLTTTYVSKFSVTDLSKLAAVPMEFLGIEREYLGDWALIRLILSLALFAFGLLLSSFAEGRIRRAYFDTLGGRVVRTVALELVARVAVAASIAIILAVPFSSSLADVLATALSAIAVVGALSSTRSYLDLARRTHELIAECHEHLESLNYRAKISEGVLEHLQGSALSSLKDLEKSLTDVRSALSNYSSTERLGVVGYSSIARACWRLRELNRELDSRLLNLISELGGSIRDLFRISTPEAREPLALLLAELETVQREPERMGVLLDLIPKVAQSLRKYCGALREMLLKTLPDSYREIFGMELSFRETPECSENSLRDLHTYQNYVLAVLIGMDRQLDSVVNRLDELAGDARRMSRVLEAYGARGHQLAKLLEVYWESFSQARLVISLELPEKILRILEMKRTSMLKITTLLGRLIAVDLKESYISQAVSEFMKPLEESLKELASPEVPLTDSITILENILRNVLGVAWALSGMYTIVENLQLLRTVQPLVSDYIRDGIKHGYKFEEVFPLRDDLRQLWLLLYGSGG